MTEPSEIQQKVFLQFQSDLKHILQAKTINQLLEMQNELTRMQDSFHFLKIYQDYTSVETNQTKEIKFEKNFSIDELPQVDSIDSDVFKEKTNIEEPNNQSENTKEITLEVEADFNNHLNEINQDNENNKKSENQSLEVSLEEKIENQQDKPEIETAFSNSIIQEKQKKEEEERKIHLSKIKGITGIQSLFVDQKETEREENIEMENKRNSLSISKSNMPIDVMEAKKPKPDFKLDLNDRIAFTKKLFNGSQSELNEVVNRLNTFNKLEDAKEYLSEIYYQKNWKNEDDFAQRLWSLVENKFQ